MDRGLTRSFKSEVRLESDQWPLDPTKLKYLDSHSKQVVGEVLKPSSPSLRILTPDLQEIVIESKVTLLDVMV